MIMYTLKEIKRSCKTEFNIKVASFLASTNLIHRRPQEPIKWSLHLPCKPLESTLSRVDIIFIRTVPREDFARRRWEEPITTTNSSKSSAERLIVDSFQGACLNVGFMTAKKKKTVAKITLPWSSVRCLCPIASYSVLVGQFINFYFMIPRSQRL